MGKGEVGMNRDEVLQTAINLTMGDRNAVHGSPNDNMTLFANLLNAAFGTKFTAKDAALTMALSKVARLIGNPNHDDSYIDAAAYIAIMAEVDGVKT
jgi:hypothetical protein